MAKITIFCFLVSSIRQLTVLPYLTERMVLKWLNRRRQRKSFNWERFREYREHYPLPKPKIVHNFYTLSPAVFSALDYDARHSRLIFGGADGRDDVADEWGG